jgi:hypothetical protein
VRFRVENAIALPRETVEGAFLDPAFYQSLGEMPNIRAPELLSKEEVGEEVHLRLRFAFDGNLPGAARRVLDPDKITWVHEETVFPLEHRSEFRMIPEHYRDRMRCSGQIHFEEVETGTIQRLEGDLSIRYPLVGHLVERAIVMGMRQHLTEEAKLLERTRGPATT